jgi:hypothetical protein
VDGRAGGPTTGDTGNRFGATSVEIKRIRPVAGFVWFSRVDQFGSSRTALLAVLAMSERNIIVRSE